MSYSPRFILAQMSVQKRRVFNSVRVASGSFKFSPDGMANAYHVNQVKSYFITSLYFSVPIILVMIFAVSISEWRKYDRANEYRYEKANDWRVINREISSTYSHIYYPAGHYEVAMPRESENIRISAPIPNIEFVEVDARGESGSSFEVITTWSREPGGDLEQ